MYLIVSFIGGEALHVEHMTAAQYYLRLYPKILEADTATILRVLAEFAFLLDLLPICSR